MEKFVAMSVGTLTHITWTLCDIYSYVLVTISFYGMV